MDEMKLQCPEEEVAVELQQPEDAAVAESDQNQEPVRSVEDILKEKVEALREDIRVLEEKEDVLTEKLCLAKNKGLNEQTDRCRDLLQRLVLRKNAKREELEKAEEEYREAQAKRMIAELSAEIDDLTAEIEGTVLPKEEEEEEVAPVFELEYDYMAKSKRLSVISKAVALVGCFAALLGAVAYMLLVLFANLAFAGWELAVFAGVAVVMIIIGMFVGKAANKNRRLGEEALADLEARKAQYEAERLERERIKAEQKAAWKIDNLDAVSEAYAIEQAKDVQLAKEAKRTKVKNKVITELAEVPSKLKENVHTVVPIAAACTAVAAVAAFSSARKKKAAAKRSAAIRREFFDWIM